MHSTEPEHVSKDRADEGYAVDTNDTYAEAEFSSEDDSLTSDDDSITDHERHKIPGDHLAMTRISVSHDSETDSVSIIEKDRPDVPTITANDLQRSSAQFLFGIKEKFKLTQIAVQGIMEGTASITQQCITKLKSEVANLSLLMYILIH